ncbi:unnamed protein product [Vitrella brassicaformis CCMP3155]|uniref:Uncharacterized protein n=1 Tax=Vitrella brassicaformis (strain CCMP3155) TaxID=1169540 RepID=A0A0G4GEC2_VITBC|nr:unnamed protein product [Vitrella brassicaformis CCMP3155]|eukprot:CEM27712.1 unnamed protein product [Vitrella brassicaformis CCMP3155]
MQYIHATTSRTTGHEGQSCRYIGYSYADKQRIQPPPSILLATVQSLLGVASCSDARQVCGSCGGPEMADAPGKGDSEAVKAEDTAASRGVTGGATEEAQQPSTEASGSGAGASWRIRERVVRGAPRATLLICQVDKHLFR